MSLQPRLDLCHEECVGPRKKRNTTFFFRKMKPKHLKPRVHLFKSHHFRLNLSTSFKFILLKVDWRQFGENKKSSHVYLRLHPEMSE